jgi:outer membrane protein assembly factor BamB
MTFELSRRRVLGALVLTGAGYAASEFPADPIETVQPSAGTWPVAQYDPANTAANPHAELGSQPSIDWQRQLDVKTLVVGRDLVVVGGDRLAALDRDTGQVVWQQTPSGDAEQLAVRNGVVYYARTDDEQTHVRAVDAQTGAVRWDRQLPDVWDSVLTARSLVLTCISEQGQLLIALDLATGEQRWQWTKDAHASLAAADGHLYGTNGYLTKHAVRDLYETVTNTGPDRVWAVEMSPAVRQPVIAGGRVFTARTLESRTNRPDSPRTAFPDGDTVSPPPREPPVPALTAHDTASGDRVWGALWSDTVPFDAGTRYGVEELAVAHGRVYAAFDVVDPETKPGQRTALIAYSMADGTREWTVSFYQEPGDFTRVTALAATSDTVVVAHRPLADPDSTPTHPPTVRALDPVDGTERWRVALPDVSYAVAIAGDTVFAVTVNGPVVAIR